MDMLDIYIACTMLAIIVAGIIIGNKEAKEMEEADRKDPTRPYDPIFDPEKDWRKEKR